MAEQEAKNIHQSNKSDGDVALVNDSIATTQKSRWERSWPVIACGSGTKDRLMSSCYRR
jgi:hypothetical protein